MHYLKAILNPAQCGFLNNTLVALLRSGRLDWTQDDYVRDCCGLGDIPQVDEFYDTVERQVRPFIGPTAIRANSYSRIYFKGAYLKPHVDRPGLDWTLSLCSFAEVEWPISAQGLDYRIASVPIAPGDGVLMRGTRQVHWREELRCRPDQLVIQHFYHWSEPSAKAE
ncbi:hypothetical protein [Methylomagnum ishizawai]|uniref:hypothetical protein n=1 Tax=Methylomagnum ishizawai TaxID=1760988 RepID=UPI001C3347DB|nr:hypothetical protein [Methylomagnum ishizawai]BBL73728.1 hypothetical protein MishRS11D_08260 [Methylomagnum ishizawai]